MGNLKDETLKGIERLWKRLDDVMFASERDTLFAATLIIKSAFANELCRYCKHDFDPITDPTDKT